MSETNAKEVVIVSACRTPIGSYGGAFKALKALDLGTIAVKEAIKRAGIKESDVDEVVLGCVLQGGLGQNIARQISVNAGLPIEVPALTINKVCGSGLRSVSLAASLIKAGDADVIIAGGVESMTNAPYFNEKLRWGARMGDAKDVDLMVYDGLTDPFEKYHMGITAENLVEKYGLTRDELDEFAANSQQKAEKAMAEGKFDEEIVSVSIPQKKGDPIVVDKDEYPKPNVTKESISKLKPAFKKDGAVTAANASGINDAGVALVVMSKEKADELGVKPMATIKSYASAGVDPKIMGIGPVPSSKKALELAGLKIDDIDLIEANEAFAAQSIPVAKELGFDMNKVNVNGGAISLGHPVGASGARILTTLLYELKRQDKKLGLATLCIGSGQGTALIVERK